MKLVADLHLHTISSGHAYSTLEEYVRQAKKIGLAAIAITDHGPGMLGGACSYHFSNLRMIPALIEGIRVYRGIEANIVDDQGNLDVADEVLARLDIVMATFHIKCGYESGRKERDTEVLLRAMENPYVNILGHPGNPSYPVAVEQIVEAAKEKKIIIEINSSSFTSRPGSWERCLDFAKEVKRQNWQVVIGSDAHLSTMLGNFDEALKLIAQAGLTEEQVVNTSLEKIERYLLKRNV